MRLHSASDVLPDPPGSHPRAPRFGLWLCISLFSLSLAPTAWAQEILVRGLWSTGNPFLDGLIVFVITALIWSFFYWGLYPRLLPHFGERVARGIFWSGFLLYAFSWLHISFFTIFSYGFFYGWIQWSFLIVVPMLSIWFLLSFVRS